jgi:geranylgeranyl pyrophosphate synthase
MVDDVLDVTGDAALLGKKTGMDAAHGKLTSVALWGPEGARAAAAREAERAREALRFLGASAEFFTKLSEDLLYRIS